MTIRFKLTFFMTVTVLITVLLSLTFTVISVRRKFEQRFYENTKAILDSAAIDLEADFIRGFASAQHLSEDPSVIAWLEQGEPEGALKTDVMQKFHKLAAKDAIISVFIASRLAEPS